MTLINTIGIGGHFNIMSADTRQTMSFFGNEFAYEDQPNKVEFLTGYTMFGGGGTVGLVNRVKDEMKARVTEDSDLEACYDVLSEVVAEQGLVERINLPVQIMLSGFFRDGRNGHVSFKDGSKPRLITYEPSVSGIGVIALSDDHADMVTESEPGNLEACTSVRDYLSAFVTHLAHIQGSIAYTDSDTVSPMFKYYVLLNEPQTGLLRDQGEIDTSQWFEVFKNKA